MELKQLKNIEDPLKIVAEKIAANARVLCFDEFHVTDITDAMLLGIFLFRPFKIQVIFFKCDVKCLAVGLFRVG